MKINRCNRFRLLILALAVGLLTLAVAALACGPAAPTDLGNGGLPATDGERPSQDTDPSPTPEPTPPLDRLHLAARSVVGMAEGSTLTGRIHSYCREGSDHGTLVHDYFVAYRVFVNDCGGFDGCLIKS